MKGHRFYITDRKLNWWQRLKIRRCGSVYHIWIDD